MESELNNVLEYIEVNIRKNIKLNEIADFFHYSVSHLSRSFNRYVGMNFNEYINRRRLSLIAIEISKKEKSISYLSDTFGYSSQKYFSTKFKDVFCITPTTYKKGKTFIVLQPIRKIKGENNIMINNLKELCFNVWSKSSDENTLLDAISDIENLILYSKDNSEVTLITYLNEENYSNIFEVKLNLINGLYDVKSIFHVDNKLHNILSLDTDDDGCYVVFEDVKTKKTLKAIFEQGHQPYVIFQTNTTKGFKVVKESSFDMNSMHKKLDILKNEILKLTNEKEIKDFCENDKNLVLMRHFGSEFVFVKLVKQGQAFALNSIYTDMMDKKIMSYHFFTSMADSDEITVVREGEFLNTYVTGELFAKSYILGGDEVVSSIFLKFPSGMSGSGGWDFSSEF
ncbi:MAG: helix-turn-helix transcriptional regulator [Candidatus Izemoplasmataceae bacterium]